MENLKQISVKIDPATLQKIDEFTTRYYSYKRNSIINNVLTAIFFNASPKDIDKLLRFWRHSGKKLKIEISEGNSNQ